MQSSSSTPRPATSCWESRPASMSPN